MKISGFTITRNAIKFNYPILESINSILPLCDEFVVNVGDSDDETLKLIKSIPSDKIRIIQNTWDFSMGKEVLSHQTNLALKACKGDWAFYLQNDEIIHEEDLEKLRKLMTRYLNTDMDAFRFKWFHFYGSYYRYRIDKGWYQKQDRIIRNNGQIVSMGDAWGFERKDSKPLKRISTDCFLYHYGWVQTPELIDERRSNAEKIGFLDSNSKETKKGVSLDDFPIYFGTHPKSMQRRIKEHKTSQQDFQKISRQYWWHPLRLCKVRYKTPRRVKEFLGK